MARRARPWFRKQTNSWMVCLGGKKVVLAVGRKKRDEAERRFHELILQRVANPHADSDEHTVASIIDLYLTHAERHLAPRTLDHRKKRLQDFAEAIGYKKVADCKAFHLTKYIDGHPGLRADWTIHSAIAACHTPFNWAVKQGLIDKNPFRGVTHRQGPARRPITREEFQMLLRASQGKITKQRPTPGARFRQILIFLWYTGARPCEASKIKWADVNFEQNLIVLREHKTVNTQRVPRPRIIAMHPVVVKLLRWIQKRNERGPTVFLTQRKTPWNRVSLSTRLQRSRKAVGLAKDCYIYGIRHAFGTRAIISGVDLKTTSVLMGHTDTRMTEHYVHLSGAGAHLASAMRQVNGAH